MQKLFNALEKYTPLSPAEKALITKYVHLKTVDKQAIFFREGQTAQAIYFVLEGCARLLYTVGGQEKTAFFYTEGAFICAGESFTYQVPAVETYQAIEPTQIAIFTREAINTLIQNAPVFARIGQIATENELIRCQKIIASFITQSPEARYLALLNEENALFQRVPQQYIASFLGISPESLSRIKARIHRKRHS